MIEIVEVELVDLCMRKYLIELDFFELLELYDCFILNEELILMIGKISLIEYFIYELLKLLNDIGLEWLNLVYDIWKIRYFFINYMLNG